MCYVAFMSYPEAHGSKREADFSLCYLYLTSKLLSEFILCPAQSSIHRTPLYYLSVFSDMVSWCPFEYWKLFIRQSVLGKI